MADNTTANQQQLDQAQVSGQEAAANSSQSQLQQTAPTVPPLPPMNPIERPGPTDDEWPEEQRTVLLVAAHPDDPEFSSGGTVARWVKAGIRVIFVVATSGDKGTADRSMTNERLSNLREDEQKAAAARLGVTTVEFLRFGDGEMMPNLELRGAVTRMIRMYKPYAVMTHDPLTLFYNNEFINHPDHRAIGQATVDAIYPTARDPLQFPEQTREGLDPHKVKEIYLWGTDQPNVLIDITDTIDDKIAALKLHVTQVGEAEELPNRIKQRAEQIGEPYGIAYAEAFRRVVMRM